MYVWTTEAALVFIFFAKVLHFKQSTKLLQYYLFYLSFALGKLSLLSVVHKEKGLQFLEASMPKTIVLSLPSNFFKFS